jgi:glycogen synthase
VRILIVSNLFPPYAIGGYEERCKDVVDALRRRGHDVLVLTSSYGAGKRVSSAGLRRTLRFHWFQPVRSLSALAISECRDYWSVVRCISRYGPDVIHVWSLRSISKNVLTAIARSRIPVVYDISDDWMSDIDKDRWFWFWSGVPPTTLKRRSKVLMRKVFSKVVPTSLELPDRSSCYFTSESIRDLYVQSGFKIGNHSVIYCGVDTHIFERPNNFSGSRSPFRILFGSQLTRGKGLFTVVEALRDLVRKGINDIRLTVVGKAGIEHGFESEVKTYLEDAGLTKLVEFKPLVQRADMPQIYWSHHVVVFASYLPEAFPLVPLEAMASGVPVVTTLAGGTRELARDGENALVFEPGDAIGLARCLERVYKEESFAQELILSALKFVRREFDISIMTRRIEDFLAKEVE